MITLSLDKLHITAPDVSSDAGLGISLQRTLRIPDDGSSYPLPPGMGRFPIRLIDGLHGTVPDRWLEHGGVVVPMYQSEALWLHFANQWSDYPFALKVGAGKINAITGEPWRDGLSHAPQDYLVVPPQSWLDGFCVAKGMIRQFVAMPLGSGYSAEEQLTGSAEFGGLQLVAYPMKRSRWTILKAQRVSATPDIDVPAFLKLDAVSAIASMGLAPGGLMRQNVLDDPYGLDAWDLTAPSRCFIHLVNSLVWRALTGEMPPHPPFTAADYSARGLPWFDMYSEGPALSGSDILANLESVADMGRRKGEVPLPENESVTDLNVIRLRASPTRGVVREGLSHES
jgi:hypothetical protein